MRNLFIQFAEVLDRVTRTVVLAVGILLSGSVLAIVVARYGFGYGDIRLQDLANYAFAVFLILSVPVCLAAGGHVRVEVFSERMPVAYLFWADAIAFALFLAPVFGLVIWAYWPELAYSWSIQEGSIETGGLAGLFVIKSVLPISAALMVIQGLAALLSRKPEEGAQT